MTELREGRSLLPPADYIAETFKLYDSLGYGAYRWAHEPEAPAFVPIPKPLEECRVMLVSSGGVYQHGQIAFHTTDDTSIRLISTEADTADLRTAHFAYDQADAQRDPNVVLPLDRMRELVADGVVGSLTPQAVTFMGGIYSARRMLAETGALIAQQCEAQEPDVVLLVPV